MLELPLLVAKKQRSTGRQPNYSGPVETVDESWKDDVRAEMRRRGWDQKDLAGQIPVVPASISNMFKPGPRQIRFKARIEDLFGWQAKSQHERDLLEKIHRRASTLSAQQIELIAGIVDDMAARKT